MLIALRRGTSGRFESVLQPEERFWGYVKKTGPDECWLWTGWRDRRGYGSFGMKHGSNTAAHRAAWQFAHGRAVPKGMVVRHMCPGGGNPPCCNPSHLAVGTHQDNVDDMVRAGRQTFGERNVKAKLTEAQVIEIRKRGASGELFSEIARDYGVVRQLVSQIVHRNIWRHIQ